MTPHATAESQVTTWACRGEWVSLEIKCACLFLTYIAAHIHTILYLSFNGAFVKNTTEIKHTGVQKTESCAANARYTGYQSTAPLLKHEWWFSRNTFRWEEKEVSAGWFSASISYRITYEGTATAVISILLWRMVVQSFPLSVVKAVAWTRPKDNGHCQCQKGYFCMAMSSCLQG